MNNKMLMIKYSSQRLMINERDELIYKIYRVELTFFDIKF